MSRIIIFLILGVSLYASEVTISTIKPELYKAPMEINADGIVIAKNRTVLSAKAEGILHLYTYNNANITKGTRIAYIEDKRRNQRLDFLKNNLKSKQNALNIEKIKLFDAKNMYKIGVSSKHNYLNEKLFLQQLQESYANLKIEYKTLLLEDKNSHIIAKGDYTITNLLPQNSFISYGMPLATLLTKKRVVKLFIDSSYIKIITKGMSVKLESSYKNSKGIVSDILPKTSNNLVEIIVQTKEEFPLNLHVNAKIVVREKEGLKIPKKSIVLVDNHPVIYIIKDNIAHLQYIEIIKDMIDFALIKNTLSTDTKIALKNAYMLHNNLRVVIK